FMLVVVATPLAWYPLFACYLLALTIVISIARIPIGYFAKRIVIELPFLIFALLMPVIATGPRTEFAGLTVSQSGLHAGTALIVKATLGVLASLTLAATTQP